MKRSDWAEFMTAHTAIADALAAASTKMPNTAVTIPAWPKAQTFPTNRELFAALAMAGNIAALPGGKVPATPDLVKLSLAQADALIAALAVPVKP